MTVKDKNVLWHGLSVTLLYFQVVRNGFSIRAPGFLKDLLKCHSLKMNNVKTQVVWTDGKKKTILKYNFYGM